MKFVCARQVDDLGRVVIPIEVYRLLGVRRGTKIDISHDDGTVVLEVHRARCYVCGLEHDMRQFKGKHVCSSCLAEMIRLKES